MKAERGSRLHTVWTLTQRPGRFIPGTPCTGGSVGPRDCLGECAEETASWPQYMFYPGRWEPLAHPSLPPPPPPSSYALHARFRFTCKPLRFWPGQPSWTDFEMLCFSGAGTSTGRCLSGAVWVEMFSIFGWVIGTQHLVVFLYIRIYCIGC